MNGDKTANLDGDNAEVIIREQLSKYKELSNNNRLKVINRKHTDKEIRKMIRGLNCKFVHGEDSKVDGKQEIKNQMSMDNEFYDILFKGHLHNFKIESENNGRYIVSTGCLSGYNDFSVNFGCSTIASQTITVVTDNKVELIKDVQLQ
jgi:predicted phosphodiesterase